MSTFEATTPAAQNELTDIVTREVSMVDRAANQRKFVVRKARQPGDPINPILADDPELKDKPVAKTDEPVAPTVEAAQVTVPPVSETTTTPAVQAEATVITAEKATEAAPVAVAPAPASEAATAPAAAQAPEAEVQKFQRCTVCGGFLQQANFATGVCTRCQNKETPAKTSKADEPAATTTTKACTCCSDSATEKRKIQPGLRASLLSGLNAIIARAQEAKTYMDATESGVGGDTWTPWEVSTQLRMIDALADCMLSDTMGGVDFEAAAVLIGAAATAEGASELSKAGAAMAAGRLQKFTSCHGDMGSALKAIGKCHKAMGDLLTELKPGVEKNDSVPAATPAAPAPVVSAPAPTPAPAAQAPVAKSTAPDTSEISKSVANHERTITELQRLVASQGALLQKALQPQTSNAIPLGETSRAGATINSDAVTWPSDMAPSGSKSNRL